MTGKKIRGIKKEIEYKNLDKETLLKKIKESKKRAKREQEKYKIDNKDKKITENDENKNIFIELWQREIEEMTDAQIADYLRKYEFEEYNQLQVVTKEQELLKIGRAHV